MTKKKSFSQLVTQFFERHLGAELGRPENTISSYSDAVTLFFKLCCEKKKKTIDKLTMEDIDDEIVFQFLDHLEKERGNQARTRNHRLAVLKSFVRYIASQDPEQFAVCGRICAIKSKSVAHKVQPSVTREQVDTFLEVIDRGSLSGLRDYALISLLNDTGARVSEVVNLKIGDLRLEKPYQISLVGKGNKQRILPLWEETVTAIQAYLNLRDDDGPAFVFLNAKGLPISRHGIGYIIRGHHQSAQEKCPSLRDIKVTPHTFRHGAIFQSIAAGNSPSCVQDYMGHASVKTTKGYFKISLEMKQKAHEAIQPPGKGLSPGSETPCWLEPGLLQYLNNLSKPGARAIRVNRSS